MTALNLQPSKLQPTAPGFEGAVGGPAPGGDALMQLFHQLIQAQTQQQALRQNFQREIVQGRHLGTGGAVGSNSAGLGGDPFTNGFFKPEAEREGLQSLAPQVFRASAPAPGGPTPSFDLSGPPRPRIDFSTPAPASREPNPVAPTVPLSPQPGSQPATPFPAIPLEGPVPTNTPSSPAVPTAPGVMDSLANLLGPASRSIVSGLAPGGIVPQTADAVGAASQSLGQLLLKLTGGGRMAQGVRPGGIAP